MQCNYLISQRFKLSHEIVHGLVTGQILAGLRLPDSMRIPNAETLESIRQAEAGEDLTSYESVDDLMAEMEAL